MKDYASGGYCIAVGLIIVWQVTIILLTGCASLYFARNHCVLPKQLLLHSGPLFDHAMTTLFEIIGGLLLGTLLGAMSALSMIASLSLKRWLLPVLVISQAIPVFAIAPLLLVLWLRLWYELKDRNGRSDYLLSGYSGVL